MTYHATPMCTPDGSIHVVVRSGDGGVTCTTFTKGGDDPLAELAKPYERAETIAAALNAFEGGKQKVRVTPGTAMPDDAVGPLPPDPDGMNDERSGWAETALVAFREATGTDREDALCDLLCDLMHLCDRVDTLGGFDAQLERARGHYEADTGGEDIPRSRCETAVAAELLAACRMVVARWEHGDLAEAARACGRAVARAAGRFTASTQGAGVPAGPVAGSAPSMASTPTNGTPA